MFLIHVGVIITNDVIYPCEFSRSYVDLTNHDWKTGNISAPNTSHLLFCTVHKMGMYEYPYPKFMST